MKEKRFITLTPGFSPELCPQIGCPPSDEVVVVAVVAGVVVGAVGSNVVEVVLEYGGGVGFPPFNTWG
jgi:hypothetical protein